MIVVIAVALRETVIRVPHIRSDSQNIAGIEKIANFKAQCIGIAPRVPLIGGTKLVAIFSRTK